MSSLVSLVQTHGSIKTGDQYAADVLVAQNALIAAGFRLNPDGVFGPGTFRMVSRFQVQHGLPADGIIGMRTAALLDLPHTTLVATATPVIEIPSGLPRDDTASLISYYGDPDAPGFDSNMVGVLPKFQLTYEGHIWPHAIQFHRKCAARFQDAFDRIWEAAGHDPHSLILTRISKFSGSHVNRPVRGSSRKSCHAFGAALDIDAEDLPMGKRVNPAIMPQPVVDAFDQAGLFWGNNYSGRPDPMHWQAAHE